MEQTKATMKHKVAVCQQRHAALLEDPNWKEVVYDKMNVNHDLLSVVYNPIGPEGEKELHDINAYIQKNFGKRVYFYVHKDIEGLKNAFSITLEPEQEQIEE